MRRYRVTRTESGSEISSGTVHRIKQGEVNIWIARVRLRENKKVIGIASEKKVRRTRSYDFCLLDIPQLTQEQLDYVAKLQRETGILVDPILGYAHEDEYPKLVNNSDV